MIFRPVAVLLVCCLSTGAPAIAEPPDVSAVFSVEAKPPNIVVHGSYLTKVRLYGFATGTGITTPGPIGEAKRQGPAGQNEIWVWPIPGEDDCCLYTRIYAEGDDSHGHLAGRVDFPFYGANDIGTALHPRWYDTTQQARPLSVQVVDERACEDQNEPADRSLITTANWPPIRAAIRTCMASKGWAPTEREGEN